MLSLHSIFAFPIPTASALIVIGLPLYFLSYSFILTTLSLVELINILSISEASTPPILSVSSLPGIINSLCLTVTMPFSLKFNVISLGSYVCNFALTTRPFSSLPLISYVPGLVLSTSDVSQVTLLFPSLPSLNRTTTFSGNFKSFCADLKFKSSLIVTASLLNPFPATKSKVLVYCSPSIIISAIILVFIGFNWLI